MSLRGVKRFRVSARVVHATVAALRFAGRDGLEAFVLWSGRRDGDIFTVADLHFPKQTSYRSYAGLCVKVDGSELHRLNVWLYEAKQVVGVQIHSHPRSAYHSDTDDAFPMATIDGSLSIVLPWFARDGWESAEIAAYRLEEVEWVEVPHPLSELIEVIGNGSR